MGRTVTHPQPASVEAATDAAEPQAIQALLRGCSIEAAAQDGAQLPAWAALLPAGADVYITWRPDDTYHRAVAFAAQLRRAGFNPVPHVIARSLAGFTQAQDFLARARGEADVAQVLVIAGDVDKPVGPFASAAQLLDSGVFAAAGIRRIGVAAYPEGHPKVGTALLDQALRAKLDFAKRSGAALYIVTQFCFEAAPILAWLKQARAAGIDLPVRVGLAGPANVRTLLKFALYCGVGPSMRALGTHATTIGRLLATGGPEAVMRDLAAADIAGAAGGVAGLHFFPFGGVARTARMIRAVSDGKFHIVPGKKGFEVDAGR